MKVLFSNPPWWIRQQGPFWRRRWVGGVRSGSRWPFTFEQRSSPDRYVFKDYLPYPFFLGYAATYAKKETGAEVQFRDSVALRESDASYLRSVGEGKFDYIFIESSTGSWENDNRLITEIHRISPESKIVLCGPVTAHKPERYLQSGPIHACIQGEFEKASVRVIRGESGVIPHDLLTVDEMNRAPFPYFDELIAPRYFDSNPIGQHFPHAQVWSSRGCPFKCIFCVWPAVMTGNDPDGTGSRKVRQHSAEYMEAFLSDLIGRYRFRSIYFDDDTFNLGKSHVLRMCEVMRKIGLPWSAMCRADTIHLETWSEMKKSGCFGVKLGFESGSQYVVDKIVNKHLDLSEARAAVMELKRLGMTVHGTFTYGLPGETKEQMMETRRYRESLPLDTFQESGTAEIEGTPLHHLSTSGALTNYSGAVIDSNYHREKDGNVKFQSLVKELRES